MFSIGGAVFYKTVKEIGILQKAINCVIRKHTALRLRFTEIAGEPQQYIEEYSYKNIPVHELPSHEVFEQYAKDKAVKPIGLSEREMYSFEIICIGSRMGILAVLSHLISDAWTFSLIISEIEEAYEHLKAGNTVQEENI